MAKKITAEQIEELQDLRRWSTAVIGFLAERGRIGPVAEQFQAAVDRAYAQNNLRGLRAGRSDLAERIGRLPQEEQEQLAKVLDTNTGSNPDSGRNRKQSPIDEIVKRGAIRDEEEYRLILSRVEEIYDDPARQDEVAMLNALLSRVS
jgi:hypothetical protein